MSGALISRDLLHFYHKSPLLYHQGQGFHSVIAPPYPLIGDVQLHDEDLFLPMLILWNPYGTYPSLFPPTSIVCPTCGSSTRYSHWQDGSSPSTQPRLIHEVDNVVLLVSAVYTCENRHKLLAHDEHILSKFPSRHMIPFLLVSRTGFTTQLVHTCNTLCRRGMNFYNIETFLIERRWLAYTRQQDMLTVHKTLIGQCVGESDFWKSNFAQCPSDFIITKFFLAAFLQEEQLYLKEMMTIPAGRCISFDHTFKVAANIGYL